MKYPFKSMTTEALTYSKIFPIWSAETVLRVCKILIDPQMLLIEENICFLKRLWLPVTYVRCVPFCLPAYPLAPLLCSMLQRCSAMPKSHDWGCCCHGLQEAPRELGNQQWSGSCNVEHNRVVAVLPWHAKKRGL